MRKIGEVAGVVKGKVKRMPSVGAFKRLVYALMEGVGSPPEHMTTHAMLLRDALKKADVELVRWVPVGGEASPPAFKQAVLVVRNRISKGLPPEVNRVLGYWDSDLGQWRRNTGKVRGQVTHYMLLPDPPDDLRYQPGLFDGE
jgi:hypothetical protein